MFSISRIKHTFSLNLFATKATIGDLKILQLRSLKITLSFSHLVANAGRSWQVLVRSSRLVVIVEYGHDADDDGDDDGNDDVDDDDDDNVDEDSDGDGNDDVDGDGDDADGDDSDGDDGS